MNTDDLARLRPAERDLPADRKQILKEHLMTELRRADETRARPPHARPRNPRRRVVLATGAVLTAAAVAVAAVAVGTRATHATRSHPTPGATQTAPATAAQLLAKIATAAARQPSPAVRNSDFTYIRSMVAWTDNTIVDGHETSVMEKLHERQIWLPVANLCVTGLLIENGQRSFLSPLPLTKDGKVIRNPPKGTTMPNFTCPSEGHLGDTTYRLLQSIPTQQDALLAYLKAGKKWTNDDPPTEIGDLIRETIMPPALAAALYRLAATLPGATLDAHVTNAAGRAGIGIIWTSKSAKQVYKNEWIFDKTTLQFIGERDFNPVTGKLSGESAIIQQGFTAKAGQLPQVTR
jgi:hypothetical protein